jgi:hypothetical protein
MAFSHVYIRAKPAAKVLFQAAAIPLRNGEDASYI